MNVVNTPIEDAGCWVEVRPLITSKLESANFAPVLDTLYRLAKPFRFVILNSKDKSVVNRVLVRFYLQLWDEQTKTQIAKIIHIVVSLL